MNKGISFLICIGSYGGFDLHYSSSTLRICLGWISFMIFFYDVERGIQSILESKTNKS